MNSRSVAFRMQTPTQYNFNCSWSRRTANPKMVFRTAWKPVPFIALLLLIFGVNATENGGFSHAMVSGNQCERSELQWRIQYEIYSCICVRIAIEVIYSSSCPHFSSIRCMPVQSPRCICGGNCIWSSIVAAIESIEWRWIRILNDVWSV